MDGFANKLLAWFDDHGRHDLPWQRDATPYHVWLSEIMLQQTQVTTVIPYYQRFTEIFPDVHVLAAAPEDAVLAQWSGLGYYARARNLHRAAQMVVTEHDGRFPADLEALQALPGVGRSTAGAILSIALGGRAAILDGNVKRVLARYHAVEGWPGKRAVADTLWAHAEAHTPGERVADYTQAIMDLGATLCTRSAPACDDCPQKQDCQARKLGQQSAFPGKKPRRQIPLRERCYVLALTPERELLLEKRPAQGIWGGLWCFPEVDDADAARRWCEQELGAKVAQQRGLEPLGHTFTHFKLVLNPELLLLSTAPHRIADSDQLRTFPLQREPEVGLAAPIRRLWQMLETELKED